MRLLWCRNSGSRRRLVAKGGGSNGRAVVPFIWVLSLGTVHEHVAGTGYDEDQTGGLRCTRRFAGAANRKNGNTDQLENGPGLAPGARPSCTVRDSGLILGALSRNLPPSSNSLPKADG